MQTQTQSERDRARRIHMMKRDSCLLLAADIFPEFSHIETAIKNSFYSNINS